MFFTFLDLLVFPYEQHDNGIESIYWSVEQNWRYTYKTHMLFFQLLYCKIPYTPENYRLLPILILILQNLMVRLCCWRHYIGEHEHAEIQLVPTQKLIPTICFPYCWKSLWNQPKEKSTVECYPSVILMRYNNDCWRGKSLWLSVAFMG